VLLQQRFAVGSFLELLESSFQFLGYGSVNHFDARKNSKRNLQFKKKNENYFNYSSSVASSTTIRIPLIFAGIFKTKDSRGGV
jgi:hypothetical protein